MSNVFKVIDHITKETTTQMHEKGAFIQTIDRQYDDQFKDNGQGKKGATIRIRRPDVGDYRETRIMNVTEFEESSDTFTVASWIGFDLSVTHDEVMQCLNNEGAWDNFNTNKLTPRINRVCSVLDQKALAYAFKNTANTVGTAGSAWTNLEVPGLARAKLAENLAPEGDRAYMQIASRQMAGIVNGTGSYFNPSQDVSKAFKEGYYTYAAGFEWYENERVITHTNGDDVAGAIDTATDAEYTQGVAMLHMDALGTSVTEGSVFTIADVYDCHFETKQAFPTLKQFVVIGTPTIGSNEGDVYFWPPIYTTGPRQNVCTKTGGEVTWTHAAQNNAIVTFVGGASTTYRQALAYTKQAYQIAFCDLPIVDDAHKCKRVSKEGLAFRVWMGNDIKTSELFIRVDILYGLAALNPQWGCRMIGAATT